MVQYAVWSQSLFSCWLHNRNAQIKRCTNLTETWVLSVFAACSGVYDACFGYFITERLSDKKKKKKKLNLFFIKNALHLSKISVKTYYSSHIEKNVFIIFIWISCSTSDLTFSVSVCQKPNCYFPLFSAAVVVMRPS